MEELIIPIYKDQKKLIESYCKFYKKSMSVFAQELMCDMEERFIKILDKEELKKGEYIWKPKNF